MKEIDIIRNCLDWGDDGSHFYEDAREALQKLQEKLEWQPIETVPKTGKYLVTLKGCETGKRIVKILERSTDCDCDWMTENGHELSNAWSPIAWKEVPEPMEES